MALLGILRIPFARSARPVNERLSENCERDTRQPELSPPGGVATAWSILREEKPGWRRRMLAMDGAGAEGRGLKTEDSTRLPAVVVSSAFKENEYRDKSAREIPEH